MRLLDDNLERIAIVAAFFAVMWLALAGGR
jgi:hypothetical protein